MTAAMEYPITVVATCTLLALCHTVQAINYELREDRAISATSALREQVTVSRRHCAQLCTAASACTAANYKRETSVCQLLDVTTGTLLVDDDSVVIAGENVSLVVEGQIAFWPLTQATQGQNQVPGGADVQFEGVTFTGDAGPWRSIPAQFHGSAASFATGTGNALITRDFSFMAAVYLEQSGEGPLLQYGAPTGWGPHVWISSNRFYSSMQYPTCGARTLHYPTPMTLNKWQTVAVSFDFTANVLSMWVDEQLVTVALAACAEEPKCEPTVHMGKWPGDGRAFKGKLTCMSVYTKAMTYQEMYDYTMPICML